jgi:hypothetical protein
MPGNLLPQGMPPYDLGTAQEAKAQSQNGAVELRLRIAFDSGKSIEWVTVRMARLVAYGADWRANSEKNSNFEVCHEHH